MQTRQQSSILLVARKLVLLRLRLLPRGSLRETFYFRIIRPAIMTLLMRKPGAMIASDSSHPNKRYFDDVSLLRSSPVKLENVKEILIIKCDHIGDFFLALQAFTILRKAFSNACITLMCGSWNKNIAIQSGLFNKIVTVDVFPEVSGQSKTNAFNISEVESYNLPFYDLAIDMKVETDTQFLLNHIKAKYKAGFEDNGLNLDVSVQRHVPPVMDFVFSAPSLNSRGVPNKARHSQTLMASFASGVVDFFDSQRETREALKAYTSVTPSVQLHRHGQGPLIGINTGSGAETRNWPLENYKSVLKSLIDKHDITLVLLGSKHQENDSYQLAEVLGHTRLINLVGVISLIELPAVINQLDLYIGHDTGGTHLAGLLGIKTLCLYAGVTPIECFGPVGENVAVLQCQELPCAPCGLSKLSDCRHGHACMKLITPDVVAKTCETLLSLKVY